MDNQDPEHDEEKAKDVDAKNSGDESEGAESEITDSSSGSGSQRKADARRRLHELEESVVSKSRSDSVRATVPGAFSEVGGTKNGKGSKSSSQDQIEQDAKTKRRLRRGRSHPSPGAAGALNQLESDVMAKSAVRTSGATEPGAVATTSGSRIGKASSDSNMDSRTAASRAKLHDLESDTLAKSRARRGGAVARKLAANGGGSGTDSAFSSVRSVNRDVRAISTQRSGGRLTLDAVSEEEGRPSESQLDTESQESYHDEPPLEQEESAPSVESAVSTRFFSMSSMESGLSENSIGRAHTARVFPVEPPASDIGSDAHNALEAFVAETVVDALGVAVVMSEEDRTKMVARLSRRYLCCGCLLFIVMTIALVVPLVIVFDGSNSGDSDILSGDNISLAPSTSPTLAPTSAGIIESMSFLSTNSISTLEALENKDSPQHHAVEWITDLDPLALDFTNPEQRGQWLQRYLLSVLYFATAGDDWVECSRGSSGCATSGSAWLTENHECDWLAVLCDSSDVVNGITFLRFHGNNLVGELPEEFFLLTNLRTAHFKNNRLLGTMSDSWGKLSNLIQLNLAGNQLSGSLPNALFEKSTSLAKVLLSDNSFEGEIPVSLTTLPLTVLRLETNELSGKIPDELFDLRTLQDLRLTLNSLTGTLSTRFGELTALTDLQLQNNQFTGSIPPNFQSLVALETLNLHGNHLTGSVSNGTCMVQFLDLTADCGEVECSCCTRCF